MPTIPIPVFALIFVLIYWVVNTLLESNRNKKLNFSEYIQNLEQKEENKSALQRILYPISNNIGMKVKISKSKEEALSEQLKKAMYDITPQEFIASQIMHAGLFTAFAVMFWLLSGNKIFIYLVMVAPFMYFYPKYLLKKRIATVQMMKRMELPSYFNPLGILMFSFNPYEAVKRSLKFAGPHLRPYVERLIADIEVYPGSNIPFENFMKGIDITEAQLFITALQQSFQTDQTRSREIIMKQIEMMRKLRDENYRTLIEKKPLEMNKYNLIVIACMLAIPLTIVAINIMTTYSGL